MFWLFIGFDCLVIGGWWLVCVCFVVWCGWFPGLGWCVCLVWMLSLDSLIVITLLGWCFGIGGFVVWWFVVL